MNQLYVLNPVQWLVYWTFGIFIWLVIGRVILSWLINFNIVNMSSPAARSLARFVHTVTEPIMRPARNLIPPLGGLDLSPILIIVAAQMLRMFIVPLLG